VSVGTVTEANAQPRVRTTVADLDATPHRIRARWLERPLSAWWCALGWLTATGVFVGLTQVLGGPTEADAFESQYSTWAVAYGHVACAYPSGPGGTDFRAPLYPLVSGLLTAITRIGHNVPFPSQAALGAGCSSALSAMNRWSFQSGAGASSLRVGYLGWFVLMAGLVAFLRASGRGRCGWEPVALVIAASAPPVFMCVERFFHPEDLVAMGLVLGCLACARRDSWAWAGVLLGWSFTSQQFVLLVAAPLVILAPSNRRMRFVGSAIGSAALVIAPLMALTSGRVLTAVLGDGATPEEGTSALSQFHVHGATLFALSRVLPIVLAMALALWMRRRLGHSILEPLPIASLIATSMTLRLVFEVNLFGYYFMAVAVMLIILDVIRGRISMYLVGWLALVTLAFDPIWGFNPFSANPPTWLWQILLVPAALAIAVSPLISAAYGESRSESRLRRALTIRLDLRTLTRPRSTLGH
jgi:hypothetical protein